MFDFRRILTLAQTQWAEYRKAYAWFLGIGIIVHFVLLLVMVTGSSGFESLNTDAQATIYYSGLFLTATLFAGRYFQAMSRTESALVTLMRPASSFEKWLLAAVIVLVLYPMAYTLAFYVCNLPAGLLAASAAEHELEVLRKAAQAAGSDARVYVYQMERLSPEHFRPFHVWQHVGGARAWASLLLCLAGVQGFAVLGSLYFRAMPFIKTAVVAFVLLLASILVGVVTGSDIAPFLGYWDAGQHTEGWRAVFYPVVWFAVPGLFWLGSYFALREREIA